MTTILLITREKRRRNLLEKLLNSDYIIIVAHKEEKISLLSEKVDIIILDFVSLGFEGLKIISWIRDISNSLIIIGWGSREKKEFREEAKLYGVYEYIDDSLKAEDISSILQRALTRRRYQEKLKSEKNSSKKEIEETPHSHFSLKDIYRYKDSLKNFSRLLSVRFDLERFLNSFLLLLREMLGINRLYILLREGENYVVKASLGGMKEIVDNVKFSSQCGLIKYLVKEGTIVYKKRVDSLLYPGINREMEIFGVEVAIPLIKGGELAGVLLLGRKVIGKVLTEEDLEFLYFLADQMGIAIENVFLYQRIASQKRYTQTILENADSGVITIDEKERIVTFNPRAEKILGLKASEMIGKDIRSLPAQIADLLYEALSTGKSYHRHEIKLPPGKCHLGVNTSQLRNGQNQIVGSMMMFTDLSPIKRLERQKKYAEKLEFLNEVSMHLSQELKNCLVPIRTFTELFPHKYLDEDYRTNFYSLVIKEVERLESLVERLLFFTQPLHLIYAPESVSHLIEESLSTLKDVDFSSIEIKREYEEDLPSVFVDKEYIVKALSNVFRNSIEGMRGKGKLCINCGKEKSSIKIEIEDNGEGIKKDYLPRVFDPFFSTRSKGMGIGLTIAQRIIEEHKGKIDLESEEGKGTKVIICLPRGRRGEE